MTDEDFKLGERLARIEGNVNLVHSKLEGIEISISNLTNGLGARVEENGKVLSAVKERVDNAVDYSNKIERKIDKHVEKHWIWITSIVGIGAGISAIGTFFLKFVK